MSIKAKEIQIVPIKSVKFYSRNRNKHSPAQIDRLVKLLEHQGMRVPLVVDVETNEVIAGNGRLEAMQKMKWKEVPVIFQSFDSEEQRYAFSVSDNGVAAWAELDFSGINADIGDFGPDFDLELLGLQNFTVDVADKEALCDEDEVPEHVEPKSKLGDLYILGEHRLLCGDSTNIQHVERLMDGQKADMVFTDPPYGVAVNNTKGSILGDEDLRTFKDSLPVLKAYSKDSAHFYVWCASGDKLPESIASFAEVIPFQNMLPVRVTHENKRGPKGAFKHNYESCLFGNNNEIGFNESKKFKVSATTLKDERYEGSGYLKVYPALWDGERSTEHNMNIEHPTQKKVEMIEFYVEISSKENESCLDLFGGSGSTLIACEKTNRKCFMMELDPHYVDVIVARYEKYTGKKAELQSSEYATF